MKFHETFNQAESLSAGRLMKLLIHSGQEPTDVQYLQAGINETTITDYHIKLHLNNGRKVGGLGVGGGAQKTAESV